jgi:hypothetical protein
MTLKNHSTVTLPFIVRHSEHLNSSFSNGNSRNRIISPPKPASQSNNVCSLVRIIRVQLQLNKLLYSLHIRATTIRYTKHIAVQNDAISCTYVQCTALSRATQNTRDVGLCETAETDCVQNCDGIQQYDSAEGSLLVISLALIIVDYRTFIVLFWRCKHTTCTLYGNKKKLGRNYQTWFKFDVFHPEVFTEYIG